MKPLISIITPVHNAAKFLPQCITSVVDQTYTEWEQILIDDCSTDDSAVLIARYASKDPRIKYQRLSKNSGAGVARNRAIKMAKGAYIAFLDSDDMWHPEKLSKQLAFMQDNSHHFTFTSYGTMNAMGEKTDKIMLAKEEVTYNSALYKNPIGCLTVMYDAGYFGKRYMPTIRKRQDYALWLELLKKTNGYGLQEVLATYRNGNESISSNKWKLLTYEWRIYREVEQLSLAKSLFYTLSAVFLKMKSYF